METKDVKYIFNTSILKKGDILLINTHNERIHELMQGVYDHVALYADDAAIIESDGCGVVMNHIFSYGFKDVNDVVVLRYKSDSDSIIEGVVFWAKSTMGMEYGTMEAKRVIDYETTDEPAVSNRMFCSRLVAMSYDQMGIKLAPNPYYCKPETFLNSDALFKVENPLVEASEESKKIVVFHSKERENAVNVEMLVELFQRESVVFETDIQTMNQLFMAAISRPEKEDEAIKIICESDYYNRRLDGREFYCLNDRKAFELKYNTLERRVWFLMNQRLHLEKTYIPSVSANLKSLSVLCVFYPISKVLAFFKNFFKEAEQELADYYTWVCYLLLEIMDKEPEAVRRIIEKG